MVAFLSKRIPIKNHNRQQKIVLQLVLQFLNLNQKRGGVGMIYKRHTQSKIIFCNFFKNELIKRGLIWITKLSQLQHICMLNGFYVQ